jgi:hypothetical protein
MSGRIALFVMPLIHGPLRRVFAMSGFPIAGEGYFAEVKTNKYQLRLFAEAYPLGHVAVVYDVGAKQDVFRDDADDLNQAKQKVEEAVGKLLTSVGAQLPEIHWQMNQILRQRLNLP